MKTTLGQGYANKYSSRAQELLNFEIVAKHNNAKNKFNFNPTSTRLKPSIDNLKMAYTFVGVPNNPDIKILGVAPYLTYLKGEGWVGAVEFFKKEGLGICAFSENNVKLSHGAVILAKEDVSEIINGKPTMMSVIGNSKSGFLYNIEWYDLTFFRQLECANEQYSPNITESVIQMAKEIDRS